MVQLIDGELWEVACDGHYAVSNFGRVMRTSSATGTFPGKILRPRLGGGYPEFIAHYESSHSAIKVHRLVAELFIGPCPVGCEVNHKDGDKRNSHVSNLEYMTHRENIYHAIQTGLYKCQITESAVEAIRAGRDRGLTYMQLATANNVSVTQARSICTKSARFIAVRGFE